MDPAKARKISVFKSRYAPQHLCLGAIFHFGLKSDNIIQRSQSVVAAQLHHRIGFDIAMGVGEADGFHRTKAQGFAPSFCHDLNWQTAVKIPRGLPLVKFGFFCCKQGVNKGFILIARHWAVDISFAFFFGLALIIARLHPRFGHINAVIINDRRNCIEKGQRVFAGFFRN